MKISPTACSTPSIPDSRQAHKVRGKRKLVETLKTLPEPKEVVTEYEVNGEKKCLDAWARGAGIPKTTLYYRVVTKGSPCARHSRWAEPRESSVSKGAQRLSRL